jgi:putative endopeptidase
MDRSADPCENLYQYACGGWIKNNPVPADQSSWGTYGKAYVDNQQYLWGILEDVAKHQDKRSGTQALLGDYFASCMNEEAIETLGAKPLESGFADIDALSDKAGLAMLIGQLIQQTDSSSFFFAVGSVQDAKDSSKVIGMVYADGLGLPDRDYYLLDEENKVTTRKAYQQHLEAMFALLQDPSPDSAAATVMRIETALASATLSRVERRDPHKTYHRKSLDELNLFTPGFNWTALFDTVGLNPSPWLNLNQPVFIEEMARLIETESLEDLKTYLRWGLVNSRAGLLSSHFRDQDFSFYGTHLRGVTEQKPRWRTCVSLVDSQLGEALGREFVERNFPPELRDDARRMSLQIQQAMGERIDNLGWMSEETRKQAREKLEKMRDKIGYPDKWRDYSAIEISRNDFFGNITRATAVDLKRQLDKIGLAVDRDEWVTSPATVNAFYNPSMNDMNFPAGVLMPPLYDPKMDDAPNYGNTGGTIGHELVHGFDDEGRQYDGDGNLRDWWSKEDAAEFEKRADCIREQYAGYRVIDEIFINSQLTSGEDIADLGGLILAWDAWKKETAGQDLKNADNLTPDQRFFVGFAQWACQNERPESLRLHAATDPHSPPIYRINGVVANMSEFAEAFQCPADAALVKPEADICKIW